MVPQLLDLQQVAEAGILHEDFDESHTFRSLHSFITEKFALCSGSFIRISGTPKGLDLFFMG